MKQCKQHQPPMIEIEFRDENQSEEELKKEIEELKKKRDIILTSLKNKKIERKEEVEEYLRQDK